MDAKRKISLGPITHPVLASLLGWGAGCNTTSPAARGQLSQAVVVGATAKCDWRQGQKSCRNSCVAIHVDPDNCGACGNRCARNHFCQLGKCVVKAQPGHSGVAPGVSSGVAPNLSPAIGSYGGWTAEGPVIGGRLDGIVAAWGALTVVASPGGAMYYMFSGDSGWTSPRNYGLGDFSMVDLQWDLQTSGRLYAPTWNGLYATSDYGDTWTQLLGVASIPGPLLPYTDPPDPRPFAQGQLVGSPLILAGSPCGGLWYSFDGSNFTQSFPFMGGSSNPDNCLSNIVIDPGSHKVYFSTLAPDFTPAHLFRSTSAWLPNAPSLTWENANTNLPLDTTIEAMASTSLVGESDHLVAVMHVSDHAEIWGADDGINWSHRANIATGEAQALVFSSGDLFLGTFGLWHTADRTGVSGWSQITVPLQHDDFRAIYADPLSGNLYAANDGGAFGEWNMVNWSWTPGNVPTNGSGVPNTGISALQLYFAAVIPPADPASPRVVVIGSQDNGMDCSPDASAALWTTSGTPWVGDAVSLRVAPSNPDRAYLWGLGGYFWRTDNARTGCMFPWINWTQLSNVMPSPSLDQNNAMAVDPNNPDVVYLAIDNAVRASTNAGVNFTDYSLPGGHLPIALAVDALGNVHAGTWRGGLFVSNNQGQTWAPEGLNVNSPEYVLGIAISGGLTPTRWAATTGGLFRSVAGAAWSGPIVGGNSLGYGSYVVNDVEVDPNCPTRVYAAFGFVSGLQQHRGGIDMTTDNGATWTSITSGEDLHQAAVADVQVDSLDPHRVYAASYGRGFWSFDWGTSLPVCQ